MKKNYLPITALPYLIACGSNPKGPSLLTRHYSARSLNEKAIGAINGKAKAEVAGGKCQYNCPAP